MASDNLNFSRPGLLLAGRQEASPLQNPLLSGRVPLPQSAELRGTDGLTRYQARATKQLARDYANYLFWRHRTSELSASEFAFVKATGLWGQKGLGTAWKNFNAVCEAVYQGLFTYRPHADLPLPPGKGSWPDYLKTVYSLAVLN